MSSTNYTSDSKASDTQLFWTHGLSQLESAMCDQTGKWNIISHDNNTQIQKVQKAFCILENKSIWEFELMGSFEVVWKSWVRAILRSFETDSDLSTEMSWGRMRWIERPWE